MAVLILLGSGCASDVSTDQGASLSHSEIRDGTVLTYEVEGGIPFLPSYPDNLFPTLPGDRLLVEFSSSGPRTNATGIKVATVRVSLAVQREAERIPLAYQYVQDGPGAGMVQVELLAVLPSEKGVVAQVYDHADRTWCWFGPALRGAAQTPTMVAMGGSTTEFRRATLPGPFVADLSGQEWSIDISPGDWCPQAVILPARGVSLQLIEARAGLGRMLFVEPGHDPNTTLPPWLVTMATAQHGVPPDGFALSGVLPLNEAIRVARERDMGFAAYLASHDDATLVEAYYWTWKYLGREAREWNLVFSDARGQTYGIEITRANPIGQQQLAVDEVKNSRSNVVLDGEFRYGPPDSDGRFLSVGGAMQAFAELVGGSVASLRFGSFEDGRREFTLQRVQSETPCDAVASSGCFLEPAPGGLKLDAGEGRIRSFVGDPAVWRG